MKFFDHESIPIHFARDGGLEVSSGTIGIDAEHGEELGPIFVLLCKPILLGFNPGEEGFLRLDRLQLEVLLEEVVSLGPEQRRSKNS